jgi:hypothetical protein
MAFSEQRRKRDLCQGPVMLRGNLSFGGVLRVSSVGSMPGFLVQKCVHDARRRPHIAPHLPVLSVPKCLSQSNWVPNRYGRGTQCSLDMVFHWEFVHAQMLLCGEVLVRSGECEFHVVTAVQGREQRGST